MPVFLRLLRPHQYIKNCFVLVGIIFAGRFDLPTLKLAAILFLAFSAMASAVYILNDILDAGQDRIHPVKKQRPIALGVISVRQAAWLSGVLAWLAVVLGSRVGCAATSFLLIYALLNIGYSYRWKHVVILDVFIIAAGFMLRLLAGTTGLGIPPSSWLLFCGLTFTLFLGFAKRQAELLVFTADDDTVRLTARRVLGDYSPSIIDQFMSIAAACTIISYGLYTVSEETIARHHTSALIYTVPFVVYGVFRYIFLLHKRGNGNDLASDLFHDPHLLVTIIAWIAVTLAIILR